MKSKLLIITIILFNIISCSQKDEKIELVEKKIEKKSVKEETISDDYLEAIKREMRKDEVKTTQIKREKTTPIPLYQKPKVKRLKRTPINSDIPAHIRNSFIESVPRY